MNLKKSPGAFNTGISLGVDYLIGRTRVSQVKKKPCPRGVSKRSGGTGFENRRFEDFERKLKTLNKWGKKE